MSDNSHLEGYVPASMAFYVKGRGKVLEEPSLIACETKTKKIVAVGSEACRYRKGEPGRIAADNPESEILAFSPLVNGVIADFTEAEQMFREMLNRGLGKGSLLRSGEHFRMRFSRGMAGNY